MTETCFKQECKKKERPTYIKPSAKEERILKGLTFRQASGGYVAVF